VTGRYIGNVIGTKIAKVYPLDFLTLLEGMIGRMRDET
jgi:hypothetical protein